jgi:hypothetical protein
MGAFFMPSQLSYSMPCESAFSMDNIILALKAQVNALEVEMDQLMLDQYSTEEEFDSLFEASELILKAIELLEEAQ